MTPNSTLPPNWATGCFYGGEIQVLIDKNNPYEKFNTLIHETYHLLYNKFITTKYNISRIVWIDESLASNFDNTTENLIKNNEFKELVLKLLKKNPLPIMSEISFDKNNVVTKEYDGYDLFKIVGRYLIETKSNEELYTYINDIDRVIKDGENILEESLKYFKEKYKL